MLGTSVRSRAREDAAGIARVRPARRGEEALRRTRRGRAHGRTARREEEDEVQEETSPKSCARKKVHGAKRLNSSPKDNSIKSKKARA